MSIQQLSEEERRKILKKAFLPQKATSIKILSLDLLDKDVKGKIDAGSAESGPEVMYWTTPNPEKEDPHFRVFLSSQGAKKRRRKAKSVGVKFDELVATELYCNLICDSDSIAFAALVNFRFWYKKMGKICWDYVWEEIRAKKLVVNKFAEQALAELIHKYKSGEWRMSDEESLAFEEDLAWLESQYGGKP